MSEINPLGNSFYLSGLQAAANKTAKDTKKEKISSTGKTKFSDLLKKNESVSEFEAAGFPPEIAEMSIEDAAIFLKDKVDIIGDKFAESPTGENILEFKKSVQQFVKFIVMNNFEVTVNRRRLRRPRASTQNFFSTYSLPPTLEQKKVQIKTINEKLDALTRSMLFNQQNNLKTLAQIDEIKGLIVDFLSS